MDNRLIELLVCPLCKGPLTLERDTQELVCPADRLAFPIRDGIPAMLENEARSLDEPVGTAASETAPQPPLDV